MWPVWAGGSQWKKFHILNFMHTSCAGNSGGYLQAYRFVWRGWGYRGAVIHREGVWRVDARGTAWGCLEGPSLCPRGAHTQEQDCWIPAGWRGDLSHGEFQRDIALVCCHKTVLDTRRVAAFNRDANFPLFSVFSVIFLPEICMLTFSIFSYFIFLFLNFLSLFVFIFCETARTRRFSVIFTKVQWHPCFKLSD